MDPPGGNGIGEEDSVTGRIFFAASSPEYSTTRLIAARAARRVRAMTFSVTTDDLRDLVGETLTGRAPAPVPGIALAAFDLVDAAFQVGARNGNGQRELLAADLVLFACQRVQIRVSALQYVHRMHYADRSRRAGQADRDCMGFDLGTVEPDNPVQQVHVLDAVVVGRCDRTADQRRNGFRRLDDRPTADGARKPDQGCW